MKRIEISVYLLPEELDIVRELAVDQGLSISALCRNLLLRSAREGNGRIPAGEAPTMFHSEDGHFWAEGPPEKTTTDQSADDAD